MINSVISEILVVGVIVAIGAFLWSQKTFWAKGLGLLAFVAAFVQLLGSPSLLVAGSVLFCLAVAIATLRAHRRRRLENRQHRQRVAR